MNNGAKIYAAIFTRKYCRDEPYQKDRLIELFNCFVADRQPIKLIGFWGVGSKSSPNSADLATCEFMNELNCEVKKVYSLGIEFTFIFATLHGIHNGYGEKTIKSYCTGMEKIFAKFNFKFIYLDTLWKKYGLSFEKIDDIFKNKPNGWWDKIENASLIETNAKNRNQRLPPKIAAQKYYIMRDLEKEMLEKEFSDSIFNAFADSRLRGVLPHLPTLYLYARRGWSNTPWFVNGPNSSLA